MLDQRVDGLQEVYQAHLLHLVVGEKSHVDWGLGLAEGGQNKGQNSLKRGNQGERSSMQGRILMVIREFVKLVYSPIPFICLLI